MATDRPSTAAAAVRSPRHGGRAAPASSSDRSPAPLRPRGFIVRASVAYLGLLQMDVGRHAHATFLKSIELLGTEVLLQVRNELG
jgi:hypothetical protein